MKVEIKIGSLVFVGEQHGGHVHVSVLGSGEPGHRPLCGRFAVDEKDWRGLELASAALDVAGRAVDVASQAVEALDDAIARMP